MPKSQPRRCKIPNYYLNESKPPYGNHEVHQDGCNWLPLVLNKKYLGELSTDQAAIAKARIYYADANGCAFCLSHIE